MIQQMIEFMLKVKTLFRGSASIYIQANKLLNRPVEFNRAFNWGQMTSLDCNVFPIFYNLGKVLSRFRTIEATLFTVYHKAWKLNAPKGFPKIRPYNIVPDNCHIIWIIGLHGLNEYFLVFLIHIRSHPFHKASGKPHKVILNLEQVILGRFNGI